MNQFSFTISSSSDDEIKDSLNSSSYLSHLLSILGEIRLLYG